MSIDKILVAIAGLIGIALTYWFFLLKKEKEVTIEVTPKEAGEFDFTCGMNMFYGKIVVR